MEKEPCYTGFSSWRLHKAGEQIHNSIKPFLFKKKVWICTCAFGCMHIKNDTKLTTIISGKS